MGYKLGILRKKTELREKSQNCEKKSELQERKSELQDIIKKSSQPCFILYSVVEMGLHKQ